MEKIVTIRYNSLTAYGYRESSRNLENSKLLYSIDKEDRVIKLSSLVEFVSDTNSLKCTASVLADHEEALKAKLEAITKEVETERCLFDLLTYLLRLV